MPFEEEEEAEAAVGDEPDAELIAAVDEGFCIAISKASQMEGVEVITYAPRTRELRRTNGMGNRSSCAICRGHHQPATRSACGRERHWCNGPLNG